MAPGYACPVCDVHEADAVHLANHLAVTASLGRADHLAWLEEHAPDWADCGPEELGERVAGFASEVETAGPTAHQHDHGFGRDAASRAGGPALERERARQSRGPGRGQGATSGETARVLAEARELTRRMSAEPGAGEGAPAGNGDEGGGDDGAGDESADAPAERESGHEGASENEQT